MLRPGVFRIEREGDPGAEEQKELTGRPDTCRGNMQDFGRFFGGELQQNK
jgi:hypothetical protein